MQQSSASNSSLAAKVGAKEFVPTPVGLPAVSPSTDSESCKADAQTLKNSASGIGLSAAAVNAPVFVPGSSSSRPTALDAKPFVPGSTALQGKQLALTKLPKSSSSVKSSSVKGSGQTQQQVQGPYSTGSASVNAQQQQAQPSEAGASPDVALPEGDDILGMTAVVPGDGPSMAAQAAEMFRALNPFPAAGRGRGSAQQPGPPQRSPRPGNGRGSPAPPAFSATGPAGGGRTNGQGNAGGLGRGRGRGRRSGPSSQRPSAGYVVGQGRMLKAGFFTSDTLRQELQQQSYLTQAQINPETEGDYGLPEVIQQYSALYPLEDMAVAAERLSQALGVQTQVVKAISSLDGQAYALRRLDPRQVIPTGELLATAEECVQRWSGLSNHPNMVGLREAFIANEVGSTPALFFSYDYHPGSLTLEQAHIQPSQTAQGLMRNPATEEQLWSYLIQLTTFLRSVHSAGLAVRPPSLAPSKVLLSSHGRVRLVSVGVAEVLASEGGGGLPPPGGPEAAALQRQDLTALGNLLLLLACAGRGGAPTLDYVTAHFSRELCHVVAGLLAASGGTGFASWRSLMAALGDRVFDELDGSNTYSDNLMGELHKESENGRLLRLLTKLEAVTERAELNGDTQWSETGDRYIAKLFRDFVFHQVDEDGAPVLDYGLMVEALNKADAGILEKVLLLSRDEISMLVVSYADIKRCIQNSYAELRARSSSSNQRNKPKAELRYNEKAGGSFGSYYEQLERAGT